MTLPVSAYLIVKNEAAHLGRALESLKEMSEIVVVDSGSSDNTVEIAKQHGAKVYHHEWMGFAKQKQYAMSLCTQTWVLNLDADEAITPAIVASIKAIIRENKFAAAYIRRANMFMGHFPHKFSQHEKVLRFFKKDKAHYDVARLVHEKAIIDGEITTIEHAMLHFGGTSVSEQTEKINTYSTLAADEKFTRGKKPSLLKLLLIFNITFFKDYIIRRNIFSGKQGFIISVIHAYYAFMKEAKLFEKS